ncbi:MAG: type II secretion system F family protein [Methylococcales bacterium]|nr:type II secretion system F family protein [Methylococcales bacterium]
MPNPSKNKTMSTESFAHLFLHLYQMETAGIPATQSLALLKTTDKNLNKRLLRMQRQLNSGLAVATAGVNAGIFNETHQALIESAEVSGRLTAVYQQLADHYSEKLNRLKKIKSRLYLPTLVLLLALLIQPIPLLIANQITSFSYLIQSIGQFLQIVLLFFIALKLPTWFRPLFQHLQIRLPIVSKWIVKRQINRFLSILAMMMDAGIPFSDALPLAVATIKNHVLKNRFNEAIQECHSGEDVAVILAQIKIIPPTAIQIISASEFSGNLAESLLNFTRSEADLIKLEDDALSEWIPRLFYFGVCLWMAKSIVGV